MSEEFDTSVLKNPLQREKTRVLLVSRVAAFVAGYVSKINGGGPSLHFSIIIENFDNYSIYGFDGQPDPEDKEKIISNFYVNTMPIMLVHKRVIDPPPHMTVEDFARALANAAHNFASYTEKYSFPKFIAGGSMRKNEYNSSSYIAGLFKSVIGYVPSVPFPGYQTPGWENPLPEHFFRSGPEGAPR